MFFFNHLLCIFFVLVPIFDHGLRLSYERSYSTDENLTDQLSFNQQGILMRFYGYGSSVVF